MVTTLKLKRTTKIERFIESLFLAGSSGVKPLELSNKINTKNITKYAYDLKKKGVHLHTGINYRITNINDATAAFHLLNNYRTERGATALPLEFLGDWK